MINYKCKNYSEKSDVCYLCDSYGRSEHINTDDCYESELEKLTLKKQKITGEEKWNFYSQ